MIIHNVTSIEPSDDQWVIRCGDKTVYVHADSSEVQISSDGYSDLVIVKSLITYE